MDRVAFQKMQQVYYFDTFAKITTSHLDLLPFYTHHWPKVYIYNSAGRKNKDFQGESKTIVWTRSFPHFCSFALLPATNLWKETVQSWSCFASRFAVFPWSELRDDQLHLITWFVLECARNKLRRLAVFESAHRASVHLQDRLTHLESAGLGSWSSGLQIEARALISVEVALFGHCHVWHPFWRQTSQRSNWSSRLGWELGPHDSDKPLFLTAFLSRKWGAAEETEWHFCFS